MSTFNLYSIAGELVGTVEQPALFATPVDQKLIHRYFLWVRTMLRPTLAHTKTRGEVSGGGKKPWKQKGTGRARVGSSRSPIWRTGGIVFGPRNTETFATRMPRTERRKALFSALASKTGTITVLDAWQMEAPKTKAVTQMLNSLGHIAPGSKVLHLHGEYDQNLFKSTSNLPTVTSKTVQAMNVIDILNCDHIVLTKDSLTALDQHFNATL